MTVATLLLFALMPNLIASVPAFAETAVLEITRKGVTTPLKLTLAELEAMEQYEHVYSTINTWPTKRWYIARGVKLRDLLSLAGFKVDEATSIKFVAADDYEMTLTVKELLEDKRYYFPGLKENHPTEGSIPGSSEGAVEVEPILALLSAEDSEDPEEMDDRNAPMLVLGQRAVTEQTWLLYVKYVKKIEVDTTPLEKWDAPKVNVPDGTALPPGTELKLENKNTDADKIYYTTDGSEPTLNSPMFNWSARRWWEQREDVDSINIPIEIVEEMISDSIDGRDVVVLKMKTIGPGGEDSEVATYTFTVDPEAEEPETGAEPGKDTVPKKSEPKVIVLTIGQKEATVDGAPYALDAEPCIDAESGRTLVPVRFVIEAFGAKVGWDSEAGRVTITDGEKEIILTLGSSAVLVNGAERTIDCAPMTLPPGRTFVPLRFVSENLGAEVDYEGNTGKITIAR